MNGLRICLTAAAVLSDEEGNVLLIRRSADRRIGAGKWAGIGGHVEPDEMEDPGKTCLRELTEEAGVPEDSVEDLNLRYIVHVQQENDIHVQYIYFGRSSWRKLSATAEGEPAWVPWNKILILPLGDAPRLVLEHFLTLGRDSRDVFVGTLEWTLDGAGSPAARMHWMPLRKSRRDQ